MDNQNIWLPPLIAVLAGTIIGWLLSQLSNKTVIKRTRKSIAMSLWAEIAGINDELVSMKKHIEAAKIKGNPDFRFYSLQLTRVKFIFQTWDIQKYTSSLWVLEDSLIIPLVGLNTVIHWFSMIYGTLSEERFSEEYTVSNLLKSKKNDWEHEEMHILFLGFCETLDMLIEKTGEIKTRLDRVRR